jgi:hypothetical protein
VHKELAGAAAHNLIGWHTRIRAAYTRAAGENRLRAIRCKSARACMRACVRACCPALFLSGGARTHAENSSEVGAAPRSPWRKWPHAFFNMGRGVHIGKSTDPEELGGLSLGHAKEEVGVILGLLLDPLG